MKPMAMALLAVMLVGCAQLQRGQLQPVKRIDKKDPIYATTCSGAVEDWGSCFAKAKATCPNGYEVLEKFEKPDAGGITRELTFGCK